VKQGPSRIAINWRRSVTRAVDGIRYAVLILTFAVAAAAQPEVVTHEAPATFDSRVNLVSVPVVVRDRDGRPVGNLSQNDFQLFDKGRGQEITKFSVETGAAAPAAIATASAAAAAPAELDKPVLPERFVAYLFDDIHMKPGDLLNARKAALQQLDKRFDPKSRMGIFTTSARTTQDFTSSLEKLHASIESIKPWEPGQSKSGDCPPISYYLADMLINGTHTLSPGLSDNQIIGYLNGGTDQALSAVFSEAFACMQLPQPAPGAAASDGALQQTLGPVRAAAQLALAYGLEETKVSLNTMRELVRSMSSLPGSRTIVMVGPGFVLSQEHRVNENDIFEKAIRAGVVVNSLDIRGMATITGFQAADSATQSNYYSGQLARYDMDEATLSQDLLGEVAAGTGGTFFHNSNALEEGLTELAARPEYAYVLGFSPDHLKLDGSYHGLKVTLKHGTGFKIEARRGYWAPNHTVGPAEEAKEEIEDAMFSREEMLDIPLKLHTEFFKQNEARAQLTVETQVDLKRLKFKKAGDRNRDSLTVVSGLFDENGRYVKGTETTVDMQLRDQTLESVQGSGTIKVSKVSFDIPPGRYIVRVVVRDLEGRAMAAENAGVAIP
jgi:VWFA-related protein